MCYPQTCWNKFKRGLRHHCPICRWINGHVKLSAPYYACVKGNCAIFPSILKAWSQKHRGKAI